MIFRDELIQGRYFFFSVAKPKQKPRGYYFATMNHVHQYRNQILQESNAVGFFVKT